MNEAVRWRAWRDHHRAGRSDVWTDDANPGQFWRGAWRPA